MNTWVFPVTADELRNPRPEVHRGHVAEQLSCLRDGGLGVPSVPFFRGGVLQFELTPALGDDVVCALVSNDEGRAYVTDLLSGSSRPPECSRRRTRPRSRAMTSGRCSASPTGEVATSDSCSPQAASEPLNLWHCIASSVVDCTEARVVAQGSLVSSYSRHVDGHHVQAADSTRLSPGVGSKTSPSSMADS